MTAVCLANVFSICTLTFVSATTERINLFCRSDVSKSFTTLNQSSSSRHEAGACLCRKSGARGSSEANRLPMSAPDAVCSGRGIDRGVGWVYHRRVYMLDHRRDGENMRRRHRLIDTTPLPICLISFSDNVAKVLTVRRMHHLTCTRSIYRDGLRGDPVTKTLYRKLPRENVWHFCRNCEHWPLSGYEHRDSSDPPYSFCNGCIQKHRDGKCEWAHDEASPPRKSG